MVQVVLTILGVIGLIATFVAHLFHDYFRDRAAKRRRDAYFVDREPLDDEAFYDRFYRGSGIPIDLVATVRKVSAECFRLPQEKLWPDDDCGELMPPSMLELDFAEFFDELAKAAGVPMSDDQIVTCQNLTLRELIALVACVARTWDILEARLDRGEPVPEVGYSGGPTHAPARSGRGLRSGEQRRGDPGL